MDRRDDRHGDQGDDRALAKGPERASQPGGPRYVEHVVSWDEEGFGHHKIAVPKEVARVPATGDPICDGLLQVYGRRRPELEQRYEVLRRALGAHLPEPLLYLYRYAQAAQEVKSVTLAVAASEAVEVCGYSFVIPVQRMASVVAGQNDPQDLSRIVQVSRRDGRDPARLEVSHTVMVGCEGADRESAAHLLLVGRRNIARWLDAQRGALGHPYGRLYNVLAQQLELEPVHIDREGLIDRMRARRVVDRFHGRA